MLELGVARVLLGIEIGELAREEMVATIESTEVEGS